MTKSVKVATLEIENCKRVRAVSLDCTGQALTVIGGKNGQGKTSILDAIMWALGGDRFKPTDPVREGAEKATIKITMDNGLEVERSGANGSLKVTSPDGKKHGQTLLNEFVSAFALNLPRFMQATGAEKAQILLDAYPELGAELVRLNAEFKRLYDQRHAHGVIADRKAKYAAELPFDPTAPQQPLSGQEMAGRMQAALSANARNDSLRRDAQRATENKQAAHLRHQQAAKRCLELQDALTDAMEQKDRAAHDEQLADASLAAAKATAAALQDQDTSAIEAELEQIDSLNARVRANESRRNAEEEAARLQEQYAELTRNIEEVRAKRLQLLASVEMPLAGLSIDDAAELTFNGRRWDGMSGSEQLRVAAAIGHALKPACGFVLLDRLEAMDLDTLREFSGWVEAKGLQVIGTRVSTGDECAIVIEDGAAAPAKKSIVF